MKADVPFTPSPHSPTRVISKTRLSLRTNSEHGGLELWLALEELVSGEL